MHERLALDLFGLALAKDLSKRMRSWATCWSMIQRPSSLVAR